MANNFNEYVDFDRAVTERPNWPRVMCFGDSWFQYPGANTTDIQKELPRLFKKSLFFNEGLAGRDSASYKRGRPRVTRALREYEFDVLLLSMGGNDVVGEELADYVKEKDDPQMLGNRQWGVVPWQVRDHIRLSAFEHGLGFLRDDLVEMLQRRTEARPECEVVLHTYDYIWPDGCRFKFGPVKAGPWVKPFLDAVGLKRLEDQRVVSSWLLDQFAVLANELVSQYPRVRLVDSRGTLKRLNQWANEIHPVNAGFKLIARERWQPVLADLLD